MGGWVDGLGAAVPLRCRRRNPITRHVSVVERPPKGVAITYRVHLPWIVACASQAAEMVKQLLLARQMVSR